MKIRLAIVALLAAAGAAFGANLKVAVLDAVLPEKMDKNVAVGVTEKISEELVASGRFMVLDRTTVARSLEEIEFQMSGLASDADIRKAGDLLGSRLGAAYVVVARVSQVGDTYFVTAKMIDVKTGEITAQASDESEGKIAVTLKIAQNVGRKLATGVKEAEKTVPPAVAATPPQWQPQPAPAVKPAAVPARLHSRFSFFYTVPKFFGETEDDIDGLGHSSSSFGLGFQWLHVAWKGFYLSAFLTALQEDASNGIDDWVVFDPMINVQAGAGWGIPIGTSLQLTAGVHAGYAGLTVGSYWPDSGEYFDGFCFGADAGLDLIVMRGVAVSLRADVTVASVEILSGSRQEAYVGVQLGVGWAY